jgi:hypothetical protein
VFRADIEDCFGTVDPELLEAELAKVCDDPRLLRLILRIVQGGVLRNGSMTTGYLGLPQGSPLSPLLANVYLHPFDCELTEAGLTLIRYADDFVLLGSDEVEVENASALAIQALKHRHLRPNLDRTGVVSLEQGFTFLGFVLDGEGRRPSTQAGVSLRQRLQELRGASRRRSSLDRVSLYEEVLRGWRQYFHSFAGVELEDPEQRLAAAEVSVSRGAVEEARSLLKGEARFSESGPQERWTHLCRACGLEDDGRDPVIVEPNKAEEYRQEARERLSESLEEAEEAKDLARLIEILRRKRRLDPEHLRTLEELSEVYTLTGQHMLGRALFQHREQQEALRQQGQPADSLESLPVMPGSWVEEDDEVAPEPAPALSEEGIALFLRWFRGREGVLAEARVAPDGRLEYRARSLFLGGSTLQSHLEGKQVLALYPLNEKGQALLCGLDVDLSAEFRRAHLGDPERMEEGRQQLLAWCRQVADHAHAQGVGLLLEESGYKGAHLWCFLEESLRMKRLQSWLRSLLKEVPSPPSCVTVELYPERDHPDATDPGRPIKLPLGVHPASGRRSRFLNRKDGAPLEPEQALAQIRPLSMERLEEWLLDRGQQDGLVALEERFPQSWKLLHSCLVLRQLVEKVKAIRDLDHGERISLLYTFGFLGDEGEAFLHTIIGLCFDYDPGVTADFMRKRMDSPISCPRLLEKHGALLEGHRCQCVFRKVPKGGYPTPLLKLFPGSTLFEGGQAPAPSKKSKVRALPLVEPVTSSGKPLAQQSAPVHRNIGSVREEEAPPGNASLQALESKDGPDIQELLRLYVEYRRQMRGIGRSLQRVSDAMHRYFDEKGLESLEVRYGLLRREKDQQGQWVWRIEI